MPYANNQGHRSGCGIEGEDPPVVLHYDVPAHVQVPGEGAWGQARAHERVNASRTHE